MKKVIAAVAVVCVMCVAGSALAQGVRQDNRKFAPQQRNERQEFCRCPDGPRFGFDGQCAPRFGCYGPQFAPNGQRPGQDRQPMPNGQRPGRDNQPMPNGQRFGHDGPVFAPDMPNEIRAKAVELAKLRIDLEEAMTARPVNKAKAIEVHAKMKAIENEIDAWRFAQRLERVEAIQKQQELNRKVPPARPAPAPAPETPAEELATETAE